MFLVLLGQIEQVTDKMEKSQKMLANKQDVAPL